MKDLNWKWTTKKSATHNPKRKVSITLQNGDTESFDFLVIACDPQDQLPNSVMPRTKSEKCIFSDDAMKSFIFQSTLVKFPKVKPRVDEDSRDVPTERFNPQNANLMDGSICGYRSETRKVANYRASTSGDSSPKENFNKIMTDTDFEYVTIYQLLDPTKHGNMDSETLWNKLKYDMAEKVNAEWFPYQWSAEIEKEVTKFHTKFFHHFEKEDTLQDTRPNTWNLFKIQGIKNTIYVHASASFECILHVYLYFENLSNRDIFPVEKKSKIAIIGAGPSGLLIARKMIEMGYSDIKIFENGPEDKLQCAGNAQTHEQDGILAELGTCYLSPEYSAMIQHFRKWKIFSDDQRLISLDQNPDGPIIREIATAGQFSNDGPFMTLLKYISKVENRKYLEQDKKEECWNIDQHLFEWLVTKPFEQPTISNQDLKPLIPQSINVDIYQVVKGFEESRFEGKAMLEDEVVKEFNRMTMKMTRAASDYLKLHKKYFGVGSPFPVNQNPVNKELFKVAIPKFLKDNNLQVLTGLFQRIYSIQCYGSIARDSTIPAFYLLTFVTPSILVANIGKTVKDEMKSRLPAVQSDKLSFSRRNEPILSALSKGWGDIWKQLKNHFNEHNSGVNISYNSEIVSIRRQKVN